MEESQPLFSQAEYLTTFATFIYGYVATQFLGGWSSMVAHRKRITLSKEHLLWTILSFVLLIDIWWTSWRKAQYINDENLLFYSTLITPFIFYFLSYLLFPDLDRLPDSNLRTFLAQVFRKLIIVMTFLLLSFLLSDYLFEKHLPQNIFFILLGIGLTTLLIIFPTVRILRRTALALSFGLLLYHLYLLVYFKQPFKQIEGFSFVEYLSVFITFIYGFVAWRFLEGWGMVITHFKKLEIGYDYLPWTVTGFLLMLDMWWGTWGRETYLEKNILYFFLSLAVPILFYFLSAILFPLELLQRGYHQLNQYYARNNKVICLFFGLILLCNSVVANVMEENIFWSSENAFRFLGIAFSTSGVITARLWVHRVILAMGLITIITHAFFE